MEAAKFNMPFKVISLPAVTPPAPLIVMLFTAVPPKKVAGKAMEEAFAKTKLAEPLLASTDPPPLVGELPEMVRVLAPTVNVPEVKASVPATLTSPPKAIPLERFKVKLFNVKAGKVVLAVPPKVRLEVAPPVREPEVLVIAPFNVKVFAPMANAPLVRVRVCETIKLSFNVRP